jgi:hypothetical protein
MGSLSPRVDKRFILSWSGIVLSATGLVYSAATLVHGSTLLVGEAIEPIRWIGLFALFSMGLASAVIGVVVLGHRRRRDSASGGRTA